MSEHRHTVRMAFDFDAGDAERASRAKEAALNYWRETLTNFGAKNVRVLDVGCGDEALMDSPNFDFTTADAQKKHLGKQDDVEVFAEEEGSYFVPAPLSEAEINQNMKAADLNSAKEEANG